MALNNIHVGDFGWAATLTVEQGGVALNLSPFVTSSQIVFRRPDGSTITVGASFATDGTDGKIKATVGDTVIDVPGFWHVRGVVAGTGVELATNWHRFAVGE